MTTTTVPSSTRAEAELGVAHAFFTAVATRDIDGLIALLHPDASWHHRNDDPMGGVHAGVEEILSFLAKAGELTAGTLRPLPQAFMADGEGHVAVLVRLTASRPDGRQADNPQMVLFTLEAGRVRAVDQFVGDPAAVAAFWA
jgi:ketosteroid isomerase-like protein